MNFGEFFDTNSCTGGARIVSEDLSYNYSINNSNNNIISGTISHNNNPPHSTGMPSGLQVSPPKLAPQPLFDKPVFNSSGLSLALQSDNKKMEGQRGDVSRTNGENYELGNNDIINDVVDGGGRIRSRDAAIEEHESRSGGSDNMDNASGDDQDASDNPPRKKRYHRHTPQQIQELEALFKECPHPDEKQRMELSTRLSLDPRQVKFWFQNRRTQMKTQIERHENTILRQEKEKLRAENMSIREAMRNPMCSNCGGPAIMGEISLEEQHLRIENARLKDELDRVCSLAGKFLGRPVLSLGSSPMPNSTGLELGVGGTFGGLGSGDHFGIGLSSPIPQPRTTMNNNNNNSTVSPIERSMYLELALAAMDELVKVAQMEEPLWIKSYDRDVLIQEEYSRSFSACIGLKPSGFVTEASRESGVVIINGLALVETLMDSGKWAEMFPCIVARTTTTDVISSGMGGTRNGALQLMHAELQVLSPLVPVRGVNFLRFCKQHAEGVWAVVDVSIDAIGEASGGGGVVPSCRRLPSGCVVQDMPNGYSKVTWVEHAEYDETVVHQLYRPLIGSGMGFGAQRWVATLQRQCERLAILMSSSVPARDQTAITAAGRKSMLKLAQRMTHNFCAGVCDSTLHKWNKLHSDKVEKDVRVMTRQSVDDPGEPSGVVVSAATSVWLSVPPHRVFDFLRNEHFRSEWDILSNGGPMQEMAHIAEGQDHGNCVSLLRASAMNPNQSSMLILQETCTDASGSLVVYAPVDIPAMHVVMNGGDSVYVALLPSGFSIVPDGPAQIGGGGSLLTVAFQILVNSLPDAMLTVESIETVNNLIACTVQKIKGALGCEDRV